MLDLERLRSKAEIRVLEECLEAGLGTLGVSLGIFARREGLDRGRVYLEGSRRS